MRKIYQILPILFLTIFVTACSKSEFAVRINNNGSADLTYRHEITADTGNGVDDYGINKAVLGDVGKGALQKQAESKGFKTETLQGAKQGFIARKHVVDFRNLLKSEQDLPIKLPEGFWLSNGLTYKEGIFVNKYTYEAKLDWSVLGVKATESEQGNKTEVSELVLEEPKADTDDTKNRPILTLTINLPLAVTKTDATLVGSNSRSLTWELVPGQTKQLYFTATEYNYYSFMYLGLLVIGFVILAIGIYYLLYRKA